MAVALETKIMEVVGLGNHYGWYNGSGSCAFIRAEAARRLQKAIEGAKADGEEIDSPNIRLIRLAEQVATSEDSQYTLTKTWQAISYIIQAHIYGDEEYYRDIEKYIRKNYLQNERSQARHWIM